MAGSGPDEGSRQNLGLLLLVVSGVREVPWLEKALPPSSSLETFSLCVSPSLWGVQSGGEGPP